jgi:hypothetical protein
MNDSNFIVKELKEKYQVLDILKKRYNNDNEILDFYNEYYNELETIESNSNMIWKLFRDIWNNEKLETILQILNLILILEKQSLYMKKLIINMKDKESQYPKLKEDKEYLLKIIENTKNTNDFYIDIKTTFVDLEEKYNINKQKFKEEIEKEYIRITNDINQK